MTTTNSTSHAWRQPTWKRSPRRCPQLTERRAVTMLVVGDRQVVEPKLQEAGFTRIRYVDTGWTTRPRESRVNVDGR